MPSIKRWQCGILLRVLLEINPLATLKPVFGGWTGRQK